MTNFVTDEAPVAERRAIALEPTRRTWLAVGSVPAMWLCYWGESAVREWSVTNNLLSMWPLTWAISSGIGSIDAGLSFGPGAVVAGVMVLTVQMVLFAVLGSMSREHSGGDNRLPS